jgi:hypothetical protein
MLGTGNYATATFDRQGEPPIIATNDDVKSKVIWKTENDVSQPLLASLSFGGRTFNFEATHNAAAAGVSLGIAWMHGIMQEEGGPQPVKSGPRWRSSRYARRRATKTLRRDGTWRETRSW